MRKITIQDVDNLYFIYRFRESLHKSYLPYFDWWYQEVMAGRVRLSPVPEEITIDSMLLLVGNSNEIIMIEDVITPDEETAEEVEVSVPAEEEVVEAHEEPVEGEAA